MTSSLSVQSAPIGNASKWASAAQWAKSPWGWGLSYTILVILFGAVVRITGSGAGCGQHWPSCHGEVAHLPQSTETLIELSHRVTSGLAMVLVFGLCWWTFRTHERGHLARKAGVWSVVFMITEALVGAGLVLLELVGQDDSAARAGVMGLHLVNTSALTFSMLAATWAWDRERPVMDWKGGKMPLAWLGALFLVVVSAAGAVTALGDTLYPVAAGTPAASVAGQAGSSAAHFLERLRSVHPLLAIGAAVYLLWAAPRLSSRVARVLVPVLVILQTGLGVVNIWLSAPGWMQVLHLGVATLLWLAWMGGLLEQAAQTS